MVWYKLQRQHRYFSLSCALCILKITSLYFQYALEPGAREDRVYELISTNTATSTIFDIFNYDRSPDLHFRLNTSLPGQHTACTFFVEEFREGGRMLPYYHYSRMDHLLRGYKKIGTHM